MGMVNVYMDLWIGSVPEPGHWLNGAERTVSHVILAKFYNKNII